MEKNQLLIEAARPLVMYLRKTCNPHVSVIVTQTGAEVVEGILTTGTEFDYPKSANATLTDQDLIDNPHFKDAGFQKGDSVIISEGNGRIEATGVN